MIKTQKKNWKLDLTIILIEKKKEKLKTSLKIHNHTFYTHASLHT